MKHDLRIAITKRMIKEGLLDLLKVKSLSKIKISELCEKSGINRATFYRHYDSLEEVLQEIESDFIKEIPHKKQPPQTIEEALLHMEAICTYLYEHSDLLKLFFSNKTTSDMVQDMSRFYREFLEIKKENLPFGELDEDTLQIRIAFIVGGGQSLLRKWILEDIHKTPAEIAAILCDMIRWP